MQLPFVPHNSRASFSSDLNTSPGTGSLSRSGRKSRVSIPDLVIINSCITPKHKKSLLCTEQNCLMVLYESKSKYPKKKFNARAPTDYEKFILHKHKVSLQQSDLVKYQYPKDVLSCKQLTNMHYDEWLTLKSVDYSIKSKRSNTSVCNIF